MELEESLSLRREMQSKAPAERYGWLRPVVGHRHGMRDTRENETSQFGPVDSDTILGHGCNLEVPHRIAPHDLDRDMDT